MSILVYESVTIRTLIFPINLLSKILPKPKKTYRMLCLE